MINNLITFLKGKKLLILGFGLEGQSTYNLIRKYLPDQMLSIADQSDLKGKYEFLTNDQNLILITGAEYLANLTEYDLIIKSPGISFKDVDTTSLENKISSQLELFLEFFEIKTIGVTGTKGKSTTTSLIYQVLTDQNQKALLLGNIGVPIFDHLESIKKEMIAVLELSSHQLEFVKRSPNIAILLNIFEEHLDHYCSLNDYIKAKFNIAKYQTNNDYFINNIDNELMNGYLNNFLVKAHHYPVTFSNQVNAGDGLYLFDQKVYFNQQALYNANDQRKLLGDHNLNNIMFVLAVSEILKLDLNETIKTINNFVGLPHRMEYVGCFDGIHFYNDAIASIPEAAINCIETLKEVDSLIVGGMDRGVNLTNIINYLNKGVVRNIICMPTTGTIIGEKLNNKDLQVFQVPDLKEAVVVAKKVTAKDKICVLSPAAASYGYFKNFQEKGDTFKRLVKEEN